MSRVVFRCAAAALLLLFVVGGCAAADDGPSSAAAPSAECVRRMTRSVREGGSGHGSPESYRAVFRAILDGLRSESLPNDVVSEFFGMKYVEWVGSLCASPEMAVSGDAPSAAAASASGPSAVPTEECGALRDLYVATGGPADWANGTGWGDGDEWDCCCGSVFGVTCDAGHVTAVNLMGNRLNGSIPETIGRLGRLQRLSGPRSRHTSSSAAHALG